ncbi:MAG TPA: RNA methyltransferase [Syntrophomonadaceae bacterium]|nr:RNA methyltransferase [Syntrophomonadaceae bacterium]
MKVISSRDNRHIKDCLKLKQRKYRDAKGLFIIEGSIMLEEALSFNKFAIQQIFLTESLANKLDLAELNSEIFLLNTRLMAEISETSTPQGVLAVVEKPVWSLENIKKESSLLVLLDRIADPGNMGTIIRTALALGVEGLLLTPACVDPFSPKVVRSSMGAIFNIPLLQNITLSDINIFKEKGFKLVGTALNNAAIYYEYDYNNPSIIVIGNEAHGLSEELVHKCDKLVKIPINPIVDSLNAGVACGIILSEAWKQKHG